MKSIDNYINERLNPRHLGHTIQIGIPIQIDSGESEIEWSDGMDTINISSSKWHYGVIVLDNKDRAICFWTPAYDYVITNTYNSLKERGSQHKFWNRTGMWEVLKLRNGVTEKADKVLDIMKKYWVTGENPDVKDTWFPLNIGFSDNINQIIDDFIKI